MLQVVRKLKLVMGPAPKVEEEKGDTVVGGTCMFSNRKFGYDYKVGKLLSRDNESGEVYECVNRSSKEIFVVKILYSKRCKYVHNEVKVLTSLNHINCVKTYAVYSCKNATYLVMDRYTGGDLFDAVVNDLFHEEKDIANVMYQLLSAITHMHNELKVAHCDIKLSNIMISDPLNLNIKLIDMGVAKAIDKERGAFKVRCGSPGFLAPETLTSEFTEAVDIWACGVVCFILFFGFNPFNPRGDSSCKNHRCIWSSIKKGFCPKLKKGFGPHFPESIPISQNAQDFISLLLTSNPELRPTASEAINHPWIQNYLPNTN